MSGLRISTIKDGISAWLIRAIGPLSRPNVRKMLPIFQDNAKELSATVDKAIEGEERGVVEGT